MKKSALIIGEFTKTEHGYTGTLETLAIKATLTFQPNDDKSKDSHPDHIVMHGTREVGVAWDKTDDRGPYVSAVFEEPSLAPGSYTLVPNSAGKFHFLYRKPYVKKG